MQSDGKKKYIIGISAVPKQVYIYCIQFCPLGVILVHFNEYPSFRKLWFAVAPAPNEWFPLGSILLASTTGC